VPFPGEVTVSLATLRYRKAEHLGAILATAFGKGWKQAPASMSEQSEHWGYVAAILRGYLKTTLKRHPRVGAGRTVLCLSAFGGSLFARGRC
jgi:hypothetical protein